MPFADSGGVKIHWEEQGRGDPLLLIMGLGYTLDMWYRTMPVLAERYRVIAFDNRGVGQSDVPPGPYSIAQLAGDAVAVLDSADVGVPAHVVGASLGGMTAQELALAQPERVRSLVLCCTSAGGPEHVPADPEVLDALQARATMSPEEGVRVMIPYVYGPGTAAERIEEDLAVRLRTFPSPEGYLAQLQAAIDHSTGGRLAELRVPTLVLHGDSDRLVPPQNARTLAERIPGARLQMIGGASHILFTDEPEATCGAILGFLEEVEG